MNSWKAWLAIGLTALGLYLVGRWQGAGQAAESVVIQQANDATSMRVRRAYHDGQAERWRIEHRAQQLSTLSRTLAESLRARAVRVDTVVTSDSGPVSLWRATANAEREAGAQCQVALLSCQTRAVTAEARVQVLDSLLTGVLKVHTCRVLFVACPSRTAVGLIGLGVGLTGGVLLHR